ncbi:helix-turn-helix domain-containing protein [Frigidibacter sp. MR17.24]|uniref:helix-turn-helix domain-containing protein n=1 Tax=Frigidibacter sp. MR17.24 TaxID=3127345 RepID=UPI003012F8D0
MIGRRTAPSTQESDKPKGFDGFELRLGDVMRGERATLSKSLLDVQRELKIKASYIAAIENADMGAFETPGFVAGYVRSYARYLNMDPEWAFARFCDEAGYEPAHGLAAAASGPKPATPPKVQKSRRPADGDPLANPNALFVPRGRSAFAHVRPGAVGSILVLAALAGGLGYGGWMVLQQMQKVTLGPVETAPVVAELDPLDGARSMGGGAETDPVQTAGMTMPRPEVQDRVWRPESLDVPVMVPRDGPIASIDPRTVGALAGLAATPQQMPGQSGGIDAALAEALGARPAEAAQGDDQQFAMNAPQPGAQAAGQAGAQPGTVRTLAGPAAPVQIVAVRPSWVRVSAADGTVLLEKILEAGERYAVPQMEEAPTLRAGNSGSVYFAVNGTTYGPAAPGAQVVKNVALTPDALSQKYALADLSQDPDLARMTNVAEAQIAPQPAPGSR